MVETEIIELTRRTADAFERHAVPYALGGALALNYWGPARGTRDIDFNVFLGADGVPEAVAALKEAGVEIDLAETALAAQEGGYARGWAGEIAVDVFFNSIPLHDSAARRTLERPLDGRPLKVLSPEDLIVLKMLFNRSKDIVDVEHIVGTQGARLDRNYVRRWLVECVGQDDSRVVHWDDICRSLPISSP